MNCQFYTSRDELCSYTQVSAQQILRIFMCAKFANIDHLQL